MRLNLVPSPHPEVVVSRYDEALFPEFRPLFELPGSCHQVFATTQAKLRPS
jgi:hypothetical protein